MEDTGKAAERELARVGPAVDSAKALDAKGEEILNLARAYLSDSKHFLAKKSYLDAFEAVVIAWAYVDAGLHLGAVKVDERFRESFTV